MGTRFLLLVRHGHYESADGGRLTAVGREQAEHTAHSLKRHLEDGIVDALWSSTLPRAKETAEIISSSLDGEKVRVTGVLREGIYSRLKGYDIPAEERAADRARADAAFAKFFRTSRVDRTEVVVCHGNLIRYLVCRAMNVSPLRWTRMNSNHCSVTRILIRGTGAVRVVAYNETGHLPKHLVT
jgi:serine/threonine-protein phosphatase PGAM5